MKQFNKYGVAVAVSALAASAVAQVKSTDNLGDAAIIPYYTVTGGKNTGVHIVNTTASTQVVKFRLRRGADSRDAMDFNIIMSPQDEWTASIQADDASTVKIVTNDTTCTAPAFTDGVALMPSTFAEGAQEGYIEIIGMGQPTAETASIAVNAEHDDGVPADCGEVAKNFFRVSDDDFNEPTVQGVHHSGLTADGSGATGLTTYDDTDDTALKVSWFIRDADGGLEVGGNANHIEGFSQLPMMTNQQILQFTPDGDLVFDAFNFELPNLNQGSYANAAGRTANESGGTIFNSLRATMGVTDIINEWSDKEAAGATVNTDWVITLPGQYLMEDPICEIYESAVNGAAGQCSSIATVEDRELPIYLVEGTTNKFTVYDREEMALEAPPGESPDLGFSPGGAPGEDATATLDREVNVMVWSQDADSMGVLESAEKQDEDLGLRVVYSAPGAEDMAGWATFEVEPVDATPTLFVVDGTAAAADSDGVLVLEPSQASGIPGYITPTAVSGETIVLGMSVWQRNFGNNAAANYGRAVEHSYVTSS